MTPHTTINTNKASDRRRRGDGQTNTPAQPRRVPPADTHFNDCLASGIRSLDRHIAAVFDAELRPLGVRSTQLTILATIANTPDATAVKLASAIHIDPSTLSRNIRRLVQSGLIAEANAQDARVVLLSLTRAGRNVLRRAQEPWSRAQRTVREMLGQELAETILTSLQALSDQPGAATDEVTA